MRTTEADLAPPIVRIAAGHLRTDMDLQTSELSALLELAAGIKKSPDLYGHRLNRIKAVWLTEKESLRTLLSFQTAVYELGGCCFISQPAPMGRREAVRDIAANTGRHSNVIVARTYRQATVDELAAHAGVPVINALSDEWHPCQALADMQTLQESVPRNLAGKKLVFVGDGNNVCASLMVNAVRMGMNFIWSGPKQYAPTEQVVKLAGRFASQHGGSVSLIYDPTEAVAGAHAVYTDTWVSMGQEDEEEQRNNDFAGYQVNQALMEGTADAIFMHCQPAHRGREVSSEVMDASYSVVMEQSENRRHAQKALLLMLLAYT